MQALHNKLHSRRGASILMALLLLLVAVMVSAVIIASAVSSAMTVKSDRLQQQAYLTVSSAAKLMRDDLESIKYTNTVTKQYSYDYYSRSWSWTLNENKTKSKSTCNGGVLLKDILKDAIDQMLIYSEPKYEKVYTITADGYDPVTATLTLASGKDSGGNDCYNLTVWFTGGTEPNKCRMCLTAQGNITIGTENTTSSSWSTKTTSQKTSVLWSLEKLQKEVTQ